MKILVFNASALHLGYLGCYGNAWVQTPNIDRLAAEGMVFDGHFADHPRRQSAFTGRYAFPRPEGNPSGGAGPSLAQALQAHGCPAFFPAIPRLSGANDFLEAIVDPLNAWAESERALFWVEGPNLAPPWDIPEDFLDDYFGPSGEKELEEEPGEKPEEEIDLTPWLDPPTGPFPNDPETRERLQITYAGAVTALDAMVGGLVDWLREEGLLDQILFILTASGGLALGEHGHVGDHRAWLHEEVVHVPLMVRLPEARDAGMRFGALTQPVDLFPTILEGLDVPAGGGHGQSLWPLIRGEVEQVRSHACSGLAIGYSLEWAMRTPGWAFLLPLSTPPEDRPRNPMLFVKPDDRWEVNDVRQSNFELAEEMEKDLREFVRGTDWE